MGESASAQPAAAAAKPQSLTPTPPMVQPDASRSSMKTIAELQAAIDALPAKKDALRAAFDRLAASSPFPLPFTWGDLDAHVSSLHSSISLRFHQLRVLEVPQPASATSAPATDGDDEKGKNLGEEEEKDEEEEEVEVEVEEVEEEEQETEEEVEVEEVEEEEYETEEEVEEVEEEEYETEEEVVEVEEVEEEEQETEEEEEVDANDEVDEEQKADEEMQEAEQEEVKVEEADGKEQKADEEMQSAEEEVVKVKEASGKEQKADKEVKAVEEQEEAGDEMREADEGQQKTKKVSPEQYIQEEKEETNKVSPKQGDPTIKGVNEYILAACTRMDSTILLKIVFSNIGEQQDYTMAMRRAPDGAALVLSVVRGFLSNKQPKTIRVWENCVLLIQCVPGLTPKLSMHMMEQAKQLAVDWKKLIDKPGSCEGLGVLASWALLHFLVSYKIVSVFDVDEIIRLFGTVPRSYQKKNCLQLCHGLGLISRITDLIDYLIGNGQQLGVVYLTRILKLEDKYPLLSLLEGYVERAKGIALELFGKNASESRELAMSREVEDLQLVHTLVKQRLTDSRQQSVILAEIKNLIAEYTKKPGLTNASTAPASNPQHGEQQTQKKRNMKRKNDQQQHEGQDSQLQGKPRILQGKQEQQQTKTQERQQQQQQQEYKPQQSKGQQQHQPQESKGQEQHRLQDKQQKEQEQNGSQQKQRQQFNRGSWRKPNATRLHRPLIPDSGILPAPNVPRIGRFGCPPYAVRPEAHSYPAQPGLRGIQGAPFAANIRAPQYMGPFNPLQQNALYRHPSFYPR